jgi:putative flippase GtrA
MKWLIKQILGFGIVGVICFIIDYGLMIVLTEFLGLNYLLSCGLSFSVSTIVNYILSMRYVFVSKENMKKSVEFVLFVILTVIGLGITEILMMVFVDKIGIHYMIAKIGVTGIVMVYNFTTRKIVLDGTYEKK